tara:strand:- start:12068 stop:13897 length:1830 start_codon:yes stop_codon:yes gene_type:complete
VALDPKTIKNLIDAHVTKANKEHKSFDKWRAWYRSEFWGELQDPENDGLLVENNYLYAFTDTMVASVCPPTPRVTCVSRQKGEQAELAAKYREALINDVLYRSDAHEILWRMSTMASVYGRSIVKSVWNFSLKRPDFVVIDPRYFFYDMTVSRWQDIRYAIEVTTLTKAEFFSRSNTRQKKRGSMQYDPAVAQKAKFGSFPQWLTDKEDTSAKLSEDMRKTFEWIVVYEVYDFTNDRYYHMLEGQEQPLFIGDLPYTFVRNPFFRLIFNDNLADIGGMADSQLVERQQRRLNELDTLELRHAQASIPVTVVNESLVDNPEDFMDQVSTATSPGDVVRLIGKNAAPLSDIMGQTPTATLVPEFNNIRDRIENTIQFVLGIPEYARGVAGTSEVATELALVDAAMRTRLGRRTKLINRAIKHLAVTTIGLYEEFLESERDIPVRTSGTSEAMTVARRHLSARNPNLADEMKARGEVIEEPLEIDYEIVPYSPTENSKTAQIKKVQNFLEVLLNSPDVNQRNLVTHIVDLLDLGKDVMASPEQAAQTAQMAQGGAPPPPQGGPMDQMPMPGGGDTIATGGMPEGASDIPTDALSGMSGGAGRSQPIGPMLES